MEDDNAKEDNQPSASKKESQRMTSAQDLYNDRRKYEERRDDHGSNSMTRSESFTSASYSARSRLDMADGSPKMPKPPIVKRETKPPEKKKRGRRPGRVEKRRRSPTRRAALRRVPKRKPRKERELSVSTIFTRLSSLSGSRTPGCKFCGHRCCRRRFEYQRRYSRKYYNRRKPRRVKRKRVIPKLDDLFPTNQGTKMIQVGSRSMMLSPLFIGTNTTPIEELPDEKNTYIEVTPEMIYQALRRLTMWRQFVLTSSIMDYLKRNYPVNHDEKELLKELEDKLRVASIVGIVTNVSEERWCLQKRTLDKTHVTKFWQIYGDTMKPVRRQKPPIADKGVEKETNARKQNCSALWIREPSDNINNNEYL
ncbi:protein SON-like [Ostrinia nubilalis]|uniref:protein SON-like n=1 Tax=Ostrinia nubilalis TaxID=29057 RepID=UPI0030822A93